MCETGLRMKASICCYELWKKHPNLENPIFSMPARGICAVLAAWQNDDGRLGAKWHLFLFPVILNL